MPDKTITNLSMHCPRCNYEYELRLLQVYETEYCPVCNWQDDIKRFDKNNGHSEV